MTAADHCADHVQFPLRIFPEKRSGATKSPPGAGVYALLQFRPTHRELQGITTLKNVLSLVAVVECCKGAPVPALTLPTFCQV